METRALPVPDELETLREFPAFLPPAPPPPPSHWPPPMDDLVGEKKKKKKAPKVKKNKHIRLLRESNKSASVSVLEVREKAKKIKLSPTTSRFAKPEEKEDNEKEEKEEKEERADKAEKVEKVEKAEKVEKVEKGEKKGGEKGKEKKEREGKDKKSGKSGKGKKEREKRENERTCEKECEKGNESREEQLATCPTFTDIDEKPNFYETIDSPIHLPSTNSGELAILDISPSPPLGEGEGKKIPLLPIARDGLPNQSPLSPRPLSARSQFSPTENHSFGVSSPSGGEKRSPPPSSPEVRPVPSLSSSQSQSVTPPRKFLPTVRPLSTSTDQAQIVQQQAPYSARAYTQSPQFSTQSHSFSILSRPRTFLKKMKDRGSSPSEGTSEGEVDQNSLFVDGQSSPPREPFQFPPSTQESGSGPLSGNPFVRSFSPFSPIQSPTFFLTSNPSPSAARSPNQSSPLFSRNMEPSKTFSLSRAFEKDEFSSIIQCLLQMSSAERRDFFISFDLFEIDKTLLLNEMEKILSFSKDQTDEIGEESEVEQKEIVKLLKTWWRIMNRHYQAFCPEFAIRLQKVFDSLSPNLSRLLVWKGMNLLMCGSASLVAQSMTSIMAQPFQNLRAAEFLDGAWEKEDKYIRSPNVMATIENFNRLASMVVESILFCDDGSRRHILSYMIKLAHNFFKINNFEGFAAVISGLNQSSIRRLKPLWNELNHKAKRNFEMMDDMLSPEMNFKGYKSALHAAESPLLPWLGPKLRDLRFMYDGNQFSSEDGFINLPHLLGIGSLIGSLLEYYKYEFDPPPCDKTLLVQFLHSRSVPEEVCYQRSIELYPVQTRKGLEKVPIS